MKYILKFQKGSNLIQLPSDYTKFLEYNKTAPENRRPDKDWQYGNPRQYDHYNFWKQNLGAPKDFEEAKRNYKEKYNEEWVPNEDGFYHGLSAAPDGVFLKTHIAGEKEPGNTSWMEFLGQQLTTDTTWGANSYSIVYDPDLQRLKYVKKPVEKKQKGGNIKDLEQSEKYDCGASALRSVLITKGKNISEKEVIKETESNSKVGTKLSKLLEAIEKYGFIGELKENCNIEDIKSELKKKNNIIILQNGVGNSKKNTDYSGVDDGHYITIQSITDNKVYFEDPANKGIKSMTYSELRSRWHGLQDDNTTVANGQMIIIKPKSKKLQQGGTVENPYKELIHQKAAKYGIPGTVYEELIKQESSLNPKSKSGAGAIGLSQIIPSTAALYKLDRKRLKTDIEYNLDAGARILADKFKDRRVKGNWKDAIGYYNSGNKWFNPKRRPAVLAESPNYFNAIFAAIDALSNLDSEHVPKIEQSIADNTNIQQQTKNIQFMMPQNLMVQTANNLIKK